MAGRRASSLALALSVVLFVASLFPEPFCVAGQCDDWPGYGILLVGALGLPSSVANATWIANPLLLSAWIMVVFNLRVPAVASSLAALVVAGSFMFMTTVVTSASGNASPVTGLRPGYWLWLASMATGFVSALLCAKQATPPQHGT